MLCLAVNKMVPMANLSKFEVKTEFSLVNCDGLVFA